MKRKTVLIENDYIEGGGVELVLYYLATYLNDKGYRVTIRTIYDGLKDFKRKYPKTIQYYSPGYEWEDPKFLTPGWWKQKISWEWYNYRQNRVDTYPYDIAIAIKEDQSMRDIAQCKAKRKFAWVHSDHRYDHWTSYYYKTKEEELSWMKRFEKVVCVSRAAQDSVKEVIGDPGNLCVIYNPIDYTDIERKAHEPCDLEKPKDKMLFVTVGRLTQQKNYLLLLEVCKSLQAHYDFEVWIVGEGPQRPELEQKIQEYGLKCVKLLGAKKNPYPYIRQGDWFVSTAEWESYGIAMQEALILGIPVLSAYCAVVDEVIDPRFGRVVPNEQEQIREGMEQLLQNPQLAGEYHDRILREYNMEALWGDRLREICELWEKTD